MRWWPVFMNNWAGCVVELLGVDGLDDGDVVHDLAEVGQQLGELGPGLTVTIIGVGRGQNLRRPPQEGEPFALQRAFGDVLAVQRREPRFVLEHVDL